MVPRELFARYVKDALANYYDPVHLQTHPLANLLALHYALKETRGQSLRQLLREAIASLQPDKSVAFGRPEWLGYRVMWLRYVESLDQPDVCLELGLSRASFYRYHRDAFDAVVSILWDRYRREAARSTQDYPGSQDNLAGQRDRGREADEETSGFVQDAEIAQDAATAQDAEIAQDAATARRQALVRQAKLAQAWSRQPIDLHAVLKGVRHTVRSLVRQQGILLHIDVGRIGDPPYAIYGDPAMLRQIILSVLTEGVKLTVADALRLSVCIEKEVILLRLRGWGKLSAHDADQAAGFETSRELLNVYGGQIWVEGGERDAPVLCFSVPTAGHQPEPMEASRITHPPNARPAAILIIDDDIDTIALYRRYLQARQYRIKIAYNSEQVGEILAEGRPDLILLDVLMPQEDGWDILQRLKTAPETLGLDDPGISDIPVVICSVLSQPRLALSLGATEVLQKPIAQEMLLATVQRLLGHQDSKYE